MPEHPEAPYTFERVEYDDARAVELRRVMDLDMNERYNDGINSPSDPAVVKALTVNPADVQATVLVIDADQTPIGHAALRLLRGDWEVKRVIVAGDQRGRGVGRALMTELEHIARAGGAVRLILQTGNKQPEAVALYTRLGYTPIAVYEPYIEAIPFSLCYEKPLPRA
ncbi:MULTISPECIES: GNAT family N-acetyltransferase [Subtercola]|uniref:GNAT family N-acetyltransferase n=1 Tax=Subtercola vilae TaxID=2056433 RepID=A0A4T2C9E6_9MICO|nr:MULTISPECIES: GNAT family N-acetyltransferase [Subtercola]MEA9985462.1 GNAT family N-acetyltransferase [Subtercola sp. RTI3]TIH39316.1 GNAT family N-acetyltransferase [Subtercola vilae]